MTRRIVPELIFPTQASAVHPAFEAAAEQAPNLRLNLKEQAELAKGLLEPGRKLYVDISQESKVNWRKASLRDGKLRPAVSYLTTLLNSIKCYAAATCSWGSEEEASAEGNACCTS